MIGQVSSNVDSFGREETVESRSSSDDSFSDTYGRGEVGSGNVVCAFCRTEGNVDCAFCRTDNEPVEHRSSPRKSFGMTSFAVFVLLSPGFLIVTITGLLSVFLSGYVYLVDKENYTLTAYEPVLTPLIFISCIALFVYTVKISIKAVRFLLSTAPKKHYIRSFFVSILIVLIGIAGLALSVYISVVSDLVYDIERYEDDNSRYFSDEYYDSESVMEELSLTLHTLMSMLDSVSTPGVIIGVLVSALYGVSMLGIGLIMLVINSIILTVVDIISALIKLGSELTS